LIDLSACENIKQDELDLENAVELETRGIEESNPSFSSFTPPLKKRLNKCYIASAVVAGLLLIIFAVIVIVHIKNAPPKCVYSSSRAHSFLFTSF
jgi:hypothetical protein